MVDEVNFKVLPAQNGVLALSEGTLGREFTVMVTFFLVVQPEAVLLSTSE